MLRLLTVLCESSEVDITAELLKEHETRASEKILSETVCRNVKRDPYIIQRDYTILEYTTPTCIFFKYIFYSDAERDVLREM